MSKYDNGTLMQRLRFPEFAHSESIVFVNGNVLFEPISNKNHNSDLPVLAITQEHGAYPRTMMDYNVFVSEKSLKSYKVVEIGDFIISLRSFEGGIEYSLFRGICSPAYIILRRRTEIVERYYKYYFKTNKFIQDLNRDLEGIRDGKMVSYSQFSDITLPKPCTKEQQKIADCLASLDELIVVEDKRLMLLKEHKKGLMQQMFPSEGKSVPKLRFPEFRTDTKWGTRKLKDVAIRVTKRNKDNLVSRVLTNSAVDGVVDQSDFFDRKITNPKNLESYFVLEKGDYVYNPRTSVTAPVGPVSKNSIAKGVISPLYTVFRFENRRNNFYEQYFKTTLWHSYLKSISNTGARYDRMNIPNDGFMDMPVPYPDPGEQERIADCLSLFDNLVSEQTKKVEILKQHKKGLMQGLFPSAQEVME